MAVARPVRPSRDLDGPHRILPADIGPLNGVFSDAFTERYRRDGMVGVRVPFLNPLIWRYAIEDAGAGAMLWRDERGQIVAFNVAHCSGREGWMGPLAVKPEWQALGVGRTIVTAGISYLEGAQVGTIGLETMPRTMDNIGFYSGLGFVPGRLTLTVTLEANSSVKAGALMGQMNARDRDAAMGEIGALVTALVPGHDYRHELQLTSALGIGDTVLLHEGSSLVGFALCHAAPLVEGRSREELRVLKLGLSDEKHTPALLAAIGDYGHRAGCRRVAIRVQGEYENFYRTLIREGGRVRWTDLRMSMVGFPEMRPARGVLLSNWEI
jgi:GNAT superfamily N-acetyltransferase